jgi:hypothetical protein
MRQVAAPGYTRAPKNLDGRIAQFSWTDSVPIFALFAAELVALAVLRMPDSLAFHRFAFCDHGTNLVNQYLIAHGFRPTIDFGYDYGLLSLLFGAVWFRLAGLTAYSYEAVMLLCGLVMGWNLASIARALKFDTAGIVLLAVALGFAFQDSYPQLAEALEAAILTRALLEQARGRDSSALALATLAILAKPTMGFFYGAIMLGWIVIRHYRSARTPREFWQVILPSVIVGGVTSLVLMLYFGPVVLLHTILPLAGRANYRAYHFGFFSASGRAFWQAPGNSWLFYFIDLRGFWIAGTIYLICAGTIAAIRLIRESEFHDPLLARRHELILTCAIAHCSFILLLYGDTGSWTYYAYFLIIGIAANAARHEHRPMLVLLTVVAVFAWTDQLTISATEWRGSAPTADTAGLWAAPAERIEWQSIVNSTRGHATTALVIRGGVELMYKQFGPPVSSMLEPGLMTTVEIGRKLQQIANSEYVIVPVGFENCGGIPADPRLRAALAPFDVVVPGRYIDLYHRRRSSQNHSATSTGLPARASRAVRSE